MEAILGKVHYLIIIWALYVCFDYYEKYMAQYTEIQKEIVQSKNMIAKKKNRMTEIKKFLKDIDTAKLRMKKAKEHLVNLELKLPGTISDFEIKSQLTEKAEKLKIKDVQVLLSPEKHKDFYFSKTYTFIGKGTYLQFLIFLEHLEKSKRIFNVGSVILAKGKENSRGRFEVIDGTITVEVYRHARVSDKNTASGPTI